MHAVFFAIQEGKGGFPQDLSQARRWLQQAAAQGYAKAQHCLETLPKPTVDTPLP